MKKIVDGPEVAIFKRKGKVNNICSWVKPKDHLSAHHASKLAANMVFMKVKKK